MFLLEVIIITKQNNTAGNQSSTRNSSNQEDNQGKVKAVSMDAVFNLFYGDGSVKFPLAYWLRNDHKVEAQYIELFSKVILEKYDADNSADLDSNIVAVYQPKGLYVPKRKGLIASTMLNHDGDIQKKQTVAQKKALDKAVEDLIETDESGVKQRQKYQDWDEEYGEVLGWVNYMFLVGTRKKSGKVVGYDLRPAPRGQTLRTKINGHIKAHNELLANWESYHLLKARFAHGNPELNRHLGHSTARGFSSDVII